MSEKQFTDGNRVTMEMVSNATGIHRTTLSKIANVKGYKTSTDVLDRLCQYFDVPLEQLDEFVKTDEGE